ncbi:hypothetical protein [Marinibactrum halimedae]|uniref:Uncharacterized protein n=1 Tax=Marinibactrum halimedae TaxID=1444977 RepID=A0AA37WNM7_9GAMM|nr:hypothetical protein [Marinibactrum halimedae]MCD9458874.1 hypothetical protein [Marinibactrum halimedae]GLS27723.1 hypothetical protein GCM10007877_34420 [Marinibactrum halimedae]
MRLILVSLFILSESVFATTGGLLQPDPLFAQEDTEAEQTLRPITSDPHDEHFMSRFMRLFAATGGSTQPDRQLFLAGGIGGVDQPSLEIVGTGTGHQPPPDKTGGTGQPKRPKGSGGEVSQPEIKTLT